MVITTTGIICYIIGIFITYFAYIYKNYKKVLKYRKENIHLTCETFDKQSDVVFYSIFWPIFILVEFFEFLIKYIKNYIPVLTINDLNKNRNKYNEITRLSNEIRIYEQLIIESSKDKIELSSDNNKNKIKISEIDEQTTKYVKSIESLEKEIKLKIKEI